MSSREEVIRHNVERTGIDPLKAEDLKHILSLLGYIAIAGIAIPLFLLKNQQFTILEGYMPNLDLIACALGYSEGPYGIFKHLYNPATSSSIGILSAQVLNYTALLGVTFLISYYTLKTKSIIDGWGRAFVMLLATYLVPGYFIAYFSYTFGEKIKSYLPIGSLENWLLTAIAGLLLVFSIIVTEGIMIDILSPHISSILRAISRKIQRF